MKYNLKEKMQRLCVAAVFVCAVCASAQISVQTPFGVPFSMQIFAIALSGFCLGAKWGTAVSLTYILMGTVGLPVFAGWQGGPQVPFGLGGGFIFGFLALVFFCGISANKGLFAKLFCGIAGLALCHLCGIIQLKLVSGIGFFAAFLGGSLPFLLKDVILVIAAAPISAQLQKIFKKVKIKNR